jgi:hypothetical protein
MATETELTASEAPDEPAPATADQVEHLERPVLAPLPAPSTPLGPLRPRASGRQLVGNLLKGLGLVIEVVLILVLATAAGMLTVLPAMPPALHVTVARTEVRAQLGSYCWFTPGHARCVDGAAGQGSLPHLKAARGSVVSLTFASPAPTTCSATATSATTSVTRPLRLIRQRGTSDTYKGALSLAPDTYQLDVVCQWAPNPMLRWLQGQGDATYSIWLRVGAR